MNDYTHIYLYAKGWYRQTSTLKDLRIIVANVTAQDPKWIDDRDILEMVSRITFRHITNEDRFIRFMLRVAEFGTLEKIIDAMLVVLWSCPTQGLDLGEPDSSILPLANDSAKMRCS